MFKYLALGDSYTIGEGVNAIDSFPYILADKLRSNHGDFQEPEVIAKTGWTSDELISAIAEKQPHAVYNLVTLLIGVNNQYRNYSLDDYKKEFTFLLKQSLHFAQGKKENVYVLSIPDWGQTPFGVKSDRNLEQIALEIDRYNQAAAEICKTENISFTDITLLTRNLANFNEPLVQDELHYAKEMHAAWVNALYPNLTLR